MASSTEPTPSRKVKVYLSYPMTKATPADLSNRDVARMALRNPILADRLEVYDPERDEPKDAPLGELQELDYQKVTESDIVIFVLGPGTGESKGQQAEMEWVRRCTSRHIHGIVLGRSEHLEGWTKETCSKWIQMASVWSLIRYIQGLLENWGNRRCVICRLREGRELIELHD